MTRTDNERKKDGKNLKEERARGENISAYYIRGIHGGVSLLIVRSPMKEDDSRETTQQ